MAPPANGNAPGRHGGKLVPKLVPKPVPALPLPYMRRNKPVAPKQQPPSYSQNHAIVPSTATVPPDAPSEATSTPKATPTELNPEVPEPVQSTAAVVAIANGVSEAEESASEVDGPANGTGKYSH
jgi:hypothetical protein